MKPITTISWAWVTATAIGLSSGGAEAAPSPISGAYIKVDDLVGSCKGPACEINVAPAPLPGTSRIVHRNEVLAALARAGVEPRTLKIPLRQRVIRPAKMVAGDRLDQRVRQAIEKVLLPDVVIEKLGRLHNVKVPQSGFELIARWPGSRSFRRQISFPIELQSDGVTFRTIQVAAMLKLKMQLPVAAHEMAAGTVVDPHDVVWATALLNTTPRRLATTANEIIGRRLEQGVGRGEPFLTNNLERIPVVRRGQQITVHSNVGLVTIKTSGTARQEGAVGDRIRVALNAVNRLVWAEIMTPKDAKVIR